jgi:hypothetical protein
MDNYVKTDEAIAIALTTTSEPAANKMYKNTAYQVKITLTTKYPSTTWVAVKFPSNLVPSVLCYKDPTTQLTINSVSVTVADRLVMLGVTGNTVSRQLKFICDYVTAGGTAEAIGNFEVSLRETAPADWSTDDYLINKKDDLNPNKAIIADPLTTPFQYFEFVWDRYWSDYPVRDHNDYGSIRLL